MGKERGISYIKDTSKRRSLAMNEAWLGRVWQRMFQRERTIGSLTMSRDGQVVRQSWQVADERAELDCTACCI